MRGGEPASSSAAEEEQQPTKELKPMKGEIFTTQPWVYPLGYYVEPRFSQISVKVVDEKDRPISGAFVSWNSVRGVITKDSDIVTRVDGVATATFCSNFKGKDTVTARVTKQGYQPLELSTEIEVIEASVELEIVNTDGVGAIYINGEYAGTGRAKRTIVKADVYNITWGDVEGYVTPEPVRLYINPAYSTAPVVIEGIYRPAHAKPENVKLTVFVCITYDELEGIPNPLPGAKVVLSNGQQSITDASGKAVFTMKANSGPLTITAHHPHVGGLEQEVEVNIGEKDLYINCDFGIAFAGDETAGTESEAFWPEYESEEQE